MWNRIKTPKELALKVKTPQKLSRWIRWNISTIKPLYGSWPTPEEVLRIKGAFCKGYAVLAYSTLKHMGYMPSLVTFMWRNYAGNLVSHAICVFHEGSRWCYFDNGVLRFCGNGQGSLATVARYACPREVYAAFERNERGELIETLITEV